ncbi:hypothetical protein [Deinococcus peraridilitoris]|uniref:Uncharacterized protein n=1 Tax=Deinococcus peraridilitoris (strain DSM 19664 / LMG 22246 / CIP 109416 / KR-200) TaxID=937777 RepID=K9ZZA9_DEIPD|nr:hypothetical protein [Deinococcus peraridilitoris]AFZ66978.1 hypothetical protein Deipe_1437 [Deinococcus peraridilitoris DSM 19664]
MARELERTLADLLRPKTLRGGNETVESLVLFSDTVLMTDSVTATLGAARCRLGYMQVGRSQVLGAADATFTGLTSLDFDERDTAYLSEFTRASEALYEELGEVLAFLQDELTFELIGGSARLFTSAFTRASEAWLEGET